MRECRAKLDLIFDDMLLKMALSALDSTLSVAIFVNYSSSFVSEWWWQFALDDLGGGVAEMRETEDWRGLGLLICM